MPNTSTQPARWPAHLLSFLGLLSVAALSLLDRGTSLMYAWPGEWAYWLMIAIPLLLLVWRTRDRHTPLQLPALSWLGWGTATATVILVSAVASPYRSVCMLWSALPLSGLATWLLVHDWLQSEPANLSRLQAYQAGAAGLLMLASAAYWLRDIAGLTSAEIFSDTLFDVRNPHPLGHSNYTAGLALLCLPALAHHAARSQGRSRGIASGGAILALLVLFTSGSRGGLLGLAALGAVAVLLSSLSRRRVWLLLAGVVLVAGIMAVANPRIRALLVTASPDTEPNTSIVQRHAMIEAGISMGKDHPLLGWGLHTTPLVYPRYRAELDGGAENVLQLHNTPIELWAGLGTAGLLLLGGFIVLVIHDRSRAPVAVATLAGYGVFALTDYQLDVPIIVMGLATLAAQLAAPNAAPTTSRSRAGLVILALGSALTIATLGHRDPTPELNTTALVLARDPANASRAIVKLQESLALNPDQEIAHFNLGWLLLVSEPAEAEKHFRAAAQLVPDKGGAYFGLALARLNQGRPEAAIPALALECLNDPRFLTSPWWNEPALATLRGPAAAIFARFCADIPNHRLVGNWAKQQAAQLTTLTPRLGQPSPGPELTYRRERTGYPVLMRNLNLTAPTDLYDVREDPRFPTSVPFPLPPKGWLPAPLLLKLLDDSPGLAHQ